MRIHEILSERQRPPHMSAETVKTITNTPAFRKWFGNSKVVAEDGTPMVVYHGTASAFEAFEVAHIGKVFGDDKHGFFFTNNTGDDMASGYASRAAQKYVDGKYEYEGANVLPVFVKIEKPFTLASYAWSMGYDVDDDADLPDEIVEDILDGRSIVAWYDMHKRDLIRDALTDGHDGIILVDPGNNGGVAENLVVAFRPDQIKSVFNKGTWNPDDARISEDLQRPLNDAFWRWFGKSKAVDTNGQPLVLYHGCIGDFDAFDPEVGNAKLYSGGSMNAHFFTDHPDNASGYAGRWTGDFTVSYKDGGNVMPVYLRMLKPLVVNARKNNWKEIPYKGDYHYLPELTEIAREKGHDSLIVKNVYDWRDGAAKVPCSTYVVFSPNQIKSIFNRGTWNPTDTRITETMDDLTADPTL